MLLLAKNPTGANETVRTVLLDPEPAHLLIALNDRTADGHDVSWIWDVDYERLLERSASLTLTGDRAYDLALRMRYSGLALGAHDRDRRPRGRPRSGRRRDTGRTARCTCCPRTRRCSGCASCWSGRGAAEDVLA